MATGREDEILARMNSDSLPLRPSPLAEIIDMNRSASIEKLATGLAHAQGMMAGAKKDSKNPFFSSTYADLASVWDACRHALSTNGLSVIQMPSMRSDGYVVVRTILAHESGQWIAGELAVKPIYINKAGEEVACNDPQGIGSAITYARRYALAAFVGVAPEDDDGNAASGRPTAARPPAAVLAAQKKADATAKPATLKTAIDFWPLAKEAKIPDTEWAAKMKAIKVKKNDATLTAMQIAILEGWIESYKATEKLPSGAPPPPSDDNDVPDMAGAEAVREEIRAVCQKAKISDGELDNIIHDVVGDPCLLSQTTEAEAVAVLRKLTGV